MMSQLMKTLIVILKMILRIVQAGMGTPVFKSPKSMLQLEKIQPKSMLQLEKIQPKSMLQLAKIQPKSILQLAKIQPKSMLQLVKIHRKIMSWKQVLTEVKIKKSSLVI